MPLFPCGHRVLVKQKEVDTTLKVGELELELVNPDDLDRKAQQDAQIEGVITHIGPDAWKAFRFIDSDGILRNGTPWAKVGDKVYFAKFSGQTIVDPESEEKYYLLNDEDITVIIRD